VRRGVQNALAVLVDCIAKLLDLGEIYGPLLELIGQRHSVSFESRLTPRPPRLVAEEVVERGTRFRRR